MKPALTAPGTPRGTIPVLSVGCAVAVSNIFLCQPLLQEIAQDLQVSPRSAGLVASAAQIGYAIGIALVVPLADIANLRRLSVVLLLMTALSLCAGALAPTLSLLALATFLLSGTTVLAQVILPTVATLAAPGMTGRVLGIVSSGLFVGTLLSRTLSGWVAELGGNWRASYLFASVLTTALVFLVPRYMPLRIAAPAGPRVRYLDLLASLPRLFSAHPEVRLSAFLGASAFGAFTSFWATLAFHLAEPPFGLGPGYAGLFGLWAAPGTLLAFQAGKLCDRYGSNVVNIVALGSIVAAYVLLGSFGDRAVWALVAGCNLMGFGAGSGQIASQARIFGLSADIRGRLNTIFMFSTFAGGAIGSVIGVLVYDSHGWRAMCLVSGITALLAVGRMLLRRRPAGLRAGGPAS